MFDDASRCWWSLRLALALCSGALLLPPTLLSQGAAHETVLEAASAIDDEISGMAGALWQFAEIALQEEKSSRFLVEVLSEAGFRLESGVADMPTAFVAEWGQGRPIIGILAEYDALPNIGNDPVPRLERRSDGHPHGHGCGHNLFGAGSVGAAMALKRAMQEHDIGGTIRLYGSPAEETVVGKVYMAKAGLFDDLDAALDWHPHFLTQVSNQTGQAMNNFTVEFFGQAAHGAFDPWNGRSALDAVEMMNFGVNLAREHIEPTARIHYVVPSAGEAPNVVPAYAKVWYYVRDIERSKVEENYAWLLDIAEAAALATRTEHKVTLTTGVHEWLLNRPLQEAAQRNLELVGAPEYSDEEHSFARQLQGVLGIEQSGLSREVGALADEPEPPEGGSTDVAEVSWITPTVSINVASAGREPALAQLGDVRFARHRGSRQGGPGGGARAGADRYGSAHRSRSAGAGEAGAPGGDRRQGLRIADSQRAEAAGTGELVASAVGSESRAHR